MDGGNPYARMVAVMRGEAGEHSASRSGLSGDQAAGETNQAGLGAEPAKMRLGTVVQRKPLEIMVAGTRQPAEVFKINERLTKGAKWKTKITAPVDVLEDPARRPSAAFFGPTGVYGPVNGAVVCGGAGCAPELTRINRGSLDVDDVIIDQTEHEQLEIDLEEGDTVMLLTEDDQMFYILMKVVDAE